MDYMAEIQKAYEQEYKNYINKLQVDLENCLKQAIDETVYQYYSPVEYQRSEQLLNSAKVHINNDGEIYLYCDINYGYFSAVDGSDQSINIANWIEYGHSDSSGINNQFHNYQGRHYLERAEQLIKEKYPELQVEIIEL